MVYLIHLISKLFIVYTKALLIIDMAIGIVIVIGILFFWWASKNLHIQ